MKKTLLLAFSLLSTLCLTVGASAASLRFENLAGIPRAVSVDESDAQSQPVPPCIQN